MYLELGSGERGEVRGDQLGDKHATTQVLETCRNLNDSLGYLRMTEIHLPIMYHRMQALWGHDLLQNATVQSMPRTSHLIYGET